MFKKNTLAFTLAFILPFSSCSKQSTPSSSYTPPDITQKVFNGDGKLLGTVSQLVQAQGTNLAYVEVYTSKGFYIRYIANGHPYSKTGEYNQSKQEYYGVGYSTYNGFIANPETKVKKMAFVLTTDNTGSGSVYMECIQDTVHTWHVEKGITKYTYITGQEDFRGLDIAYSSAHTQNTEFPHTDADGTIDRDGYTAYTVKTCSNADIGIPDGTGGGVSVYLQNQPITIHSADGTDVTPSWFKI